MVVSRTTVWSDGNVLTASALNGEFNNLLNAPAIVNADIAGGAAIAYSKLNLTGSIVNSDISSSAAIVYSKLSLSGSIQNGDLAGGITYSKLTLGGNIVNADISGSAGITYGKLNLSNSIQNSDLAGGIASSKINVTFPSGTIVGTTDTQTLSNKTLTKPTVNASIQGLVSDSDSATITFDMSTSNIHSVTLAGNRILAVTNVSVGQAFVLRLVQDATGNRVVTWFSGIHWTGGSAPTLATTGSHWDDIGFICTSSGVYDGLILGANIS